MELTKESINADIESSDRRIAGAMAKLSAIPTTETTWKEGKKIKADRHRWTAEAEHIKHLLSHAEQALQELET